MFSMLARCWQQCLLLLFMVVYRAISVQSYNIHQLEVWKFVRKICTTNH